MEHLFGMTKVLASVPRQQQQSTTTGLRAAFDRNAGELWVHNSSFFDCFCILFPHTLIAILQGETDPQINKNIPQDNMYLLFMIAW